MILMRRTRTITPTKSLGYVFNLGIFVEMICVIKRIGFV